MSDLILIVDDEEDLVDALEFSFKRDGFRTRTALNGTDAIVAATKIPLPDLILLDVMLPDMLGTEVCRRLKADERGRNVPIVMLTAKGDEVDRIVGFELGVDDYVVKPFSTRELILRVRAVLRRQAASPEDRTPQTYRLLTVDYDAGRVWVDDEPLRLTALELKLLEVLTTRRGRIQSRTQLLDEAWEDDVAVEPRTVDTHIKRLRQKLGPAGDMIETRRGLGYVFEFVEE